MPHASDSLAAIFQNQLETVSETGLTETVTEAITVTDENYGNGTGTALALLHAAAAYLTETVTGPACIISPAAQGAIQNLKNVITELEKAYTD